jgi:AcrR family transcriptional regulator
METEGLRQSKKNRTRLAMREAAIELFVDRGYEDTTVAEIAATAGVSEPTFFRYFATKAAVFLVPLEDRIEKTLDALEAQPAELSPMEACIATARSAGAVELLPAPIEAPYLRQLRNTPALRLAMLDAFDAAVDRMSGDFARRMASGPDDLEVRQTAAAVASTLQEVFFQWSSGAEVDIQRSAVECFERLRGGLD